MVVIRDLRDALVSWYYSMKVSHEDIPGTRIARIRESLRPRSLEEGLLCLIEGDEEFTGLLAHAGMRLSWLGSCDLMVRYEELLEDEAGQFDRLLRCCGIEVEPERTRSWKPGTNRMPRGDDHAAFTGGRAHERGAASPRACTRSAENPVIG